MTSLGNLYSTEIMDQWKRQRRKTNAGKRNTFSSTESLEDSEQSGMLQMLNVKKKHSLSINTLLLAEPLIHSTEYHHSILNRDRIWPMSCLGCFGFVFFFFLI